MNMMLEVTTTNEPLIEMIIWYSEEWDLQHSEVHDFVIEAIVMGFVFDSTTFHVAVSSRCAAKHNENNSCESDL